MSDEANQEQALGDIEDQLQERNRVASEMRDKCLYRSSVRTLKEAHRTATAERKLIPLLLANFNLMNAARNTLEPSLGREAAVENIAFLESPERAHAFQGDVDEAHYEHTVHWMSACSYDNLAVATAMEHGYNSEGMQACIAEGMNICRRTGKTECITCFREYASSVHRAADDLEMAMQFARGNLNRPPDPNHDRRWGGADTLSELLMLKGEFDAAWEVGQQAWELTSTFHTPLHARRNTAPFLAELAHLAGRPDWIAAAPSLEGDQTPPGEDLLFDLEMDEVRAVAAAMAKDYDTAIGLLTEWDKRLTDQRSLDNWFEVRLRLIAAYLLKSQRGRADALAKSLREKASQAKDYLTLRRLDGMLDGSVPVLPIPLVAAPVAGGNGKAGSDAAISMPTAPATRPLAAAEPTPLAPLIQVIAGRIQAKVQGAQETSEPPDMSAELADLMAQTPDRYEDACSIMHLAGVATILSASAPSAEIWTWAQRMAAAFPQKGPVLNALARLGDILRQDESSGLADQISAEQVGRWYRQSLDMDANQPNGFARAGEFFMGEGELAEAERCYARAFRLDRANTAVAASLAEIYRQSDRSTDALSVLDMCLREGGESPQLLWEAGLTAFGLSRWEATESYLARLEALAPGGQWTWYYRSMALLELGRYDDALTAIDRQVELLDAHPTEPGEPKPTRLYVHCIRASAAAAQGEIDALRAHAQAALAVRLADIHDLAMGGIASNLGRLHNAVASLPADDPIRSQVHRLMLASGMMPDSYFDEARKQAEKQQELMHFIVRLRQPLGASWAEHPACLPGQQDWTESIFTYGVLADDETDARGYVLEVHDDLFEQPGEIEVVDPQGGPFHDHPGVTLQAAPEPVDDEEDEEEQHEQAELDDE